MPSRSVYLGPWLTADVGGEIGRVPPAGTLACLDLSPDNPSDGLGVGLFVTDRDPGPHHSMLGHTLDDQVNRKLWKDRVGMPSLVASGSILDALRQTLGELSDPEGGTHARPLTPASGHMELHLGGLVHRERFTGKGHRAWDQMRALLRGEYRAMKKRDPALAAAWATDQHRALGVDFHDLADKDDEPRQPGTSFSDSFNRSNNTDISTGGPLTWTETSGDMEISSNQLRAVSAVGTLAECRAEHDVASSNHYAQITVAVVPANSSESARACARFSPSARTHYMAYTDFNVNLRRLIAKRVAGTFTQLAATSQTWTNGDTVRCRVNGSTISVERNGSSLESVTDTAIATGTRGGCVNQRSSTCVLDAFVIDDEITTGGLLLKRRRAFQ